MTVVERGDVFVSNESLTHLFGQKLQQSENKLKDVQVDMKDNEVHFSGKMKKLIWMPFSLDGTLSFDDETLTSHRSF